MLIEDEGVYKKLVCPDCEGDNIGESGLGGKLVHCFTCMFDILRGDCAEVPVTSEEELRILQQPPY